MNHYFELLQQELDEGRLRGADLAFVEGDLGKQCEIEATQYLKDMEYYESTVLPNERAAKRLRRR